MIGREDFKVNDLTVSRHEAELEPLQCFFWCWRQGGSPAAREFLRQIDARFTAWIRDAVGLTADRATEMHKMEWAIKAMRQEIDRVSDPRQKI